MDNVDPDYLLQNSVEELRAYPPSAQPGIPLLAPLPKGWFEARLESLVEVVQRPEKLYHDCEYQMVTAKRNRGGIVMREVLEGRRIATKSQFAVRAGDFIMSRRTVPAASLRTSWAVPTSQTNTQILRRGRC